MMVDRLMRLLCAAGMGFGSGMAIIGIRNGDAIGAGMAGLVIVACMFGYFEARR